jgi:hypothetical protein
MLSAFVKLLIALLFKVVHISEQAQISSLDRLLAETGWCSSRSLGPGKLPADGFHLLFLRGPTLAIRSRTAHPRGSDTLEYTLYNLGGRCAMAISEKLSGNPRDVVLRYVYAPCAWRTSSVTMRAAPPTMCHAWQTHAIRTLLGAYGARSRATVLVCGSMGTGKSTLGELLAVSLTEVLHLQTEVVKNLDLASRGLLLEDVFATPTLGSPVILMLDEFDSTIDHAERTERGDEKSEGTSLAATPTSLLALLDRLNRTPYLIVIATSNRTVEEMTTGMYGRYTREGRIDAHVRAEGTDPLGKDGERRWPACASGHPIGS